MNVIHTKPIRNYKISQSCFVVCNDKQTYQKYRITSRTEIIDRLNLRN